MDRRAKGGVSGSTTPSVAVFAALAGALFASACATFAPKSCATDYAALRTGELDTIRAGEQVVRKVLIEGVPEDQLSPEEIEAVERMEAVQESRSRVVDQVDLDILDRASAILSSPEKWDRADDRVCEASDETFSLFCALKAASEQVAGEYEHRRTALQEVRFAIEDIRPGVEYEHRLRDFNNEDSTRFDEVRGVLSAARRQVAERLARQSRCLT